MGGLRPPKLAARPCIGAHIQAAGVGLLTIGAMLVLFCIAIGSVLGARRQ